MVLRAGFVRPGAAVRFLPFGGRRFGFDRLEPQAETTWHKSASFALSAEISMFFAEEGMFFGLLIGYSRATYAY